MQGERTYEIHDVLGKGGFGTVYSATLRGESGFTKHVAVKILNEDIEGSSDHASRLRDEARLLGLVRHRAILHVDGLVSFGGRWAIVTEYVPGVNLLRLISRNKLPVGVALEVAAEVAGALHAAYTGRDPEGHELRLVHRDIKPSNIQITRAGEVKLLDFGIAQAQFGDRESKTTDVLLGSPAYMSPEQLDMRYGPEGDVYGLGVVLCEAMTGKRFGKTSANRDLHLAHVERVLAKVSDVLGADFANVEPLLKAMLAYEDRPDAHEVEARCLALRRQIGAPWLREWAQEQVEALGERGASTDELVGQKLVEGTTGVAAAAGASAPPLRRDPSQPPERAAQRKPRTKRPPWLVPFVSVGAFAVAFVATMWISAAAFRAWTQPAPPDASLSLVADGGPPLPDEASGTGEPMAAPAPAPAPVPVPPPPAPPKPAPRPASGGSGDLVSIRQFATWVGSHPEWSRDQAITEGTADTNYLRGWTGADPPAGSGGVLTNVTWAAAQEYCKGRGGLPAVGAAPREWPESDGVFQEWRVDGERPAWRRYDGATSTAVRIKESNAFTGFRCAR